MTAAQRRNYLKLDEFRLQNAKDPRASFDALNPLMVELGFGNGEALTQFASDHTDWNCVGVEVYRAGIGMLINKCLQSPLNNVRIVEAEATTALEQFPNTSINLLWVLFPDPWPKTRHQKRRLVNEEFTEIATEKLTEGATIHLATDWKDYAEHISSLFNKRIEFVGSTPDQYLNRTETPYERRARRSGRAVWDLVYRRV